MWVITILQHFTFCKVISVKIKKVSNPTILCCKYFHYPDLPLCFLFCFAASIDELVQSADGIISLALKGLVTFDILRKQLLVHDCWIFCSLRFNLRSRSERMVSGRNVLIIIMKYLRSFHQHFGSDVKRKQRFFHVWVLCVQQIVQAWVRSTLCLANRTGLDPRQHNTRYHEDILAMQIQNKPCFQVTSLPKC